MHQRHKWTTTFKCVWLHFQD